MPIAPVSSRELSQDVCNAEKPAQSGSVLITTGREPAGRGRSLVDALSMPGLADIDFAPPRVRIGNGRHP